MTMIRPWLGPDLPHLYHHCPPPHLPRHCRLPWQLGDWNHHHVHHVHVHVHVHLHHVHIHHVHIDYVQSNKVWFPVPVLFSVKNFSGTTKKVDKSRDFFQSKKRKI